MKNPTSSSGGHSQRWRTRWLLAVALVVPIVGITDTAVVDADPGTSVVVYDAIGSAPPANVPSMGYQATQTAELGDMVSLAVGPRALESVTVLMSSWGCESGTWNGGSCTTTSGATFSHPLTLNVYAVTGSDAAPELGALLATTTQTFDIPFRPSADNTNCTGANAGKWFDAGSATCYNGFSTPVTFEFPGSPVLPSRIVWAIAYNTTSYGTAPLGTGTACFATPQGCGYDSLNVGVESLPGAPFAGTDVTEADIFYSSSNIGNYCSASPPTTGTLRNDPGCWAGYRPLAKITTKYNAVTTVVVKATDLHDWVVDTTVLGNPAVPFGFTGPADSGDGFGSFRFGPIGAPNGAKQEMQPPVLNTLVSEFGGMQYDFQVITPVAGTSANHFYTNVYVDSSANGIGFFGSGASSTGFYDCRYSFVPSSSVAGWNTFSFDNSTTAVNPTSRHASCGATTIGGAPAGSEIEFFRLSGGDTSGSDTGLEGAYDLVSLTVDGDTTTYDFETAAETIVVQPSDLQDWVVDTTVLGNPAVPFDFEGPADNASGASSFEFGPIGSPNGAKQEMQPPILNGLVSDFGGMQYDFQVITPIAGNSANHFYTNVYVDSSANGIGFFGSGASSTGFYDCRYSFVPNTSDGGWNTFSFDNSTTAVNPTSRHASCGATTIGGAPAGSQIEFFRLSGGDTSGSDIGLKGAYDRVALTFAGTTTTYDFEADAPIDPQTARILDTRNPGGHTVDGLHQAVGRMTAGQTYELPVAGRAGLPLTATSVVLNVTAVLPLGAGYITVFECGQPLPNASNVNFEAGEVIANSVSATIGGDGKICIYSSAPTDVLVDVTGFFRALVPLVEPGRVLDTRTPGGETADGQHQAVGRLAAGATYELPVAGRVGVAPGAATAVLNVAAVLPSQAGFLTVFPCGQTRPNASNLNYVVGDQIANSVLARVGTAGKICIFSSAETDVLVDVSGFFTDFVSLVQLPVPSRMLDTRTPTGQTIDGLHKGVGRVAAGSTYELPITGRAGISGGVESVVLNVTAVLPSADGYVTVFACGEPIPNASNLNFAAGEVIPNFVLVSIGVGGSVCIFSSAETDLLVDVSGYFAP